MRKKMERKLTKLKLKGIYLYLLLRLPGGNLDKKMFKMTENNFKICELERKLRDWRYL